MSERNKELIRELTTSFEQNDYESFLNNCTDDIVWEMAGEPAMNGKDSIREMMLSVDMEPPKLTIDTLIAEGDTAVCTGGMTMKQKDGSTANFSYCDVYTFNGEKISRLVSYVVKQKTDAERKADAAQQGA